MERRAESRSSATGTSSFAKAERATDAMHEYVEQFGELFHESVRLRLMADVPLGMFLSGGIDSSAIAAAMSEMVDEPIKTFSVAFDEREANELEYARRSRAHSGPTITKSLSARTVLRRASSARLSGGRAYRAPLERAALLRLKTRVPSTSRSCSRAKEATSCSPATTSTERPSTT